MTAGTKDISLVEFADRLDEIMTVLGKEFFKQQTADFYKTKVTMPQLVILNIIDGHVTLRMTDLAKFLNVTTSAVTGITDRLVKYGYVVRAGDPEDRRIVKVSLTEKGEKLVKAMNRKRRQMVMDAFGRISQRERETYLDILQHMKEHLKQ